MKTISLIATIIGYSSLAGLTLSSLLFLSGRLELDQTKQHILIATFVWFITAGFNMYQSAKRDK